MRQAFGDDLRRLQGRLAQGRVFDEFAVALGLAPQAYDVTANEFADFPFHFRIRRRVDFGGLTRLEKAHDWYPRSAPLRAELHYLISARECDRFTAEWNRRRGFCPVLPHR